MIVYSEKYPGIIVICPECGALLGIDPHKDLYEEKYVYCPLCKHKIDSGIREVEWHFAVERREEAQPDDKENSDIIQQFVAEPLYRYKIDSSLAVKDLQTNEEVTIDANETLFLFYSTISNKQTENVFFLRENDYVLIILSINLLFISSLLTNLFNNLFILLE